MSDSGNDKTYAIFDRAANLKIVGDLKKTGANVFLFPPIETEKISLSETETNDLENLDRFDWLIFNDVFAADYFLETLEEMAFDLFDLDNLRICAFGETVSDRLRFASVHADVIPVNVAAPEVFSALLNYIGEGEMGNLKFLYLTGKPQTDSLAADLRAKNSEVVEMPIYRTIFNESGELIRLKTLLKGGAIDEFILTAPTDLIALKTYFKPESLAQTLAEIKISAADGIMFQAAKENNLSRAGLFHSVKVGKVS